MVLLVSFIAVALTLLQILPDRLGFAGIVATAPGILITAVGLAGPIGREGVHNVWAVSGMGGQGG